MLKKVNIDSPPHLSVLNNISTVGIKTGSFTNNLTTGRRSLNTMGGNMIFSMNGTPLLLGNDYEIWKFRMRIHLLAVGINVLGSIINGYTEPKKVKTIAQEDAKNNN